MDISILFHAINGINKSEGFSIVEVRVSAHQNK
jgi:hypothetical protein